MISLLEFLQDLCNPALAFLPKALLVSMLSAALCGAVGVHVVLRGMAFIGDAIAHAVFPGLAIAFVLGGSLILGGMLGGVSIALLVAVFSQRHRVREDSLIGIFFAAAFAVGLVVLSRSQAYAGSLASFLSGSITGVETEDIVLTAGTCLLTFAVLGVTHRELVAASLDRESARAAGVPVWALDVALYLAVAMAVVVSVHTVGNILVLALLVTPAATARLLCQRLIPTMLTSVVVGVASSFLGIYAAWALDVPVGAAIVLTATAVFLVAFAWQILRERLPLPSRAASMEASERGGKAEPTDEQD